MGKVQRKGEGEREREIERERERERERVRKRGREFRIILGSSYSTHKTANIGKKIWKNIQNRTSLNDISNGGSNDYTWFLVEPHLFLRSPSEAGHDKPCLPDRVKLIHHYLIP